MAQQPNPGDRYTDDSHNPYEAESQAIFNRPKPTDSDNPTGEPGGDSSGSSGAKKQLQVDSALRDEVDKAFNQFGYTRGEPQQKGSGWKRFLNKRNAIIGGASGGIVGIAISIFGFLTPFKVPALMQLVTDAAGQRVEQITTHRAKVILANAILSRMGYNKGVVITPGGPLDSLLATLRTNNFEDKLRAKGLTIEDVDGGVRLKFNGDDLGVFKNADRIASALSANQLTNKMLNDIIKEEIPTWRWMKRAKFAGWLRIKYGIKRYGFERSTNKDADAAARETEAKRIETVASQQADGTFRAIECLDGRNCENTLLDADEKPAERTVGSTNSGTELRNSIDQAGKSLADSVAEKGIKTAVKGGLSTAFKAIPIIQLIQLAATIDHFMWTATEDTFIKIPATFRGNSAAQIYGSWAGYGDQIKYGDTTATYNGVLSGHLDGAETSQAFSCMNGDCSKGVPVKDRINEDALTNNESAQLAKQMADIWRIANAPQHAVLNIWYTTVEAIGGALGDLVAPLLNQAIQALGFQGIIDWANEIVAKLLDSAMSAIGLTIDPLAVGADLFNNVDMGGNVAFNAYCKDLGCRKLTSAQATEQNRTIAQERSAELASMSWWDRAFSPDVNTSLTSRLAMVTPTALSPQSFDLSNGMTQLASLVGGAPSRLFSPLASAGTPKDAMSANLYGIIPYGATDADLNQDMASQVNTGADCPKVAEGEYNNCNIDKTVIQAMQCNFAPNSDACNFSDEPIGSPASGGNTDTGEDTGSGDTSGEAPSAQGFVWPIKKSDYNGLTNCYRKPGHTGIDFSAAIGTPVYAAKGGTVVATDTGGSGAGGKYIIIKHDNGYWTNYQHNSKILVNEGQAVTAGQQISESGNTGFSTGPHLHFSVTTKQGLDSRNSVAYSLNPMEFLPKDRSAKCSA